MTNADKMMPLITLAMISRQYLMGLGLQKLFERREMVRIVVYPDLRAASDVLFLERQPDVFILDLETEPDIVDAIRLIRGSAPTSKIILLSGFEGTYCTREAFACGVDGIILKVQPPAVIVAAIEALYVPVPIKSQSMAAVDPRALALQDAEITPPSPMWLDRLTKRQREVIGLIDQGLSNKDIANRLCIADSTVRHHLTGIFDKVGVSNRQKLLIRTQQARVSFM